MKAIQKWMSLKQNIRKRTIQFVPLSAIFIPTLSQYLDTLQIRDIFAFRGNRNAKKGVGKYKEDNQYEYSDWKFDWWCNRICCSEFYR